jgi:hypothetical protein
MVVLNDNLIACIESTLASVWLCNINEASDPDIVRLLGARVEADRSHILLYIPVSTGAGVLNNLSVSPALTFLTALIHTYESYQIKGRYISHRESTDEEMAYQEKYMDIFTNTLARQGLSREKSYNAYFQQPTLTMRIAVEEVYEQTPRNGAGKKMVF